MAKHLPAFARFIDDLRAAFADAGGDTALAMSRAQEHLEAFVMDDSIHAHSKSWPSTEGHKNLLLYEDPDYNFVINAVVRTLDRKRGIHDHAHAWTAYGLLDGEEELSRYRRLDDGTREGYAEVALDGVAHGRRGTVDLVPPYGIHSENGGAHRSVAVIIRSERLVGKVLQGRYKPDTNTHYVGEGPTQVPFDITETAEATL
ncbi:MAG: putative metal-dependent enzyme (double-stranded beta helix superfamily) [Alphaproteobacteria bacterium]|jgi:predicted metal-dependent enzyme (double-stranded beta helix superfamily)